MKNFLLTLSLLLNTAAFAESVDYSKGNTNPFYNYKYKTPQEQSSYYVSDYFSNEIADPISSFEKNNKQSLSPKNNSSKYASGSGKYKFLIENQHKLNGCWESAATTYKLDPWLLMAIAKVESSFNSKAVNINKNKSMDIGMMQINDIWLPTLKKHGIRKEHLFEPCTSVFVGAWIMAQNIKHFGYNRDGIGAYNSPRNVEIRRNYAKKVYAAYSEITQDLYYKKRKN